MVAITRRRRTSSLDRPNSPILAASEGEPDMTEEGEPIAIPAWVPWSLRAAYGRIAAKLGEEAAASQIRSRKRSMTPKELQRDAEAEAE
jgi:hypothetical protein